MAIGLNSHLVAKILLNPQLTEAEFKQQMTKAEFGEGCLLILPTFL